MHFAPRARSFALAVMLRWPRGGHPWAIALPAETMLISPCLPMAGCATNGAIDCAKAPFADGHENGSAKSTPGAAVALPTCRYLLSRARR